jgi:uncharacterized protein (UPF0332 family)
MNEEQRTLLASTWMYKAESAIRDASLLKENGRLHACINRLYYAVFYAASAVLAFRGNTYGRHSAVRSSIHRDFVNQGLIGTDLGRIYDILLSRREQADYQPTIEFAVEEVDEYFNRAEEMLEAFKRLIR